MMERRNYKRFIPKRISTGFDSEQDVQNAASLIRSVVGLTGHVADAAKQEIDARNDEMIVDAKLSAAKIEADQQAEMINQENDQAEKAAKIRGEIAELRNMEQRENHYNRKEQQRQRLGWRSEIADKTPEELRGLSASVLGFDDPVAATALDEAIGQMKAAQDFNALIQTSLSDPSKSLSDHLDEWLELNTLEHDAPNKAYRAEMRKIVDPYLRRQVFDDAEQAQRARFAGVMEDISTNVRLLLPEMTKSEFEAKVYQGFDDLRRLQPKLTFEAYQASVAEVLEKALVGPEAEFAPSKVIAKLDSWYTREEQARAGLLPLMARLRQAEARGRTSGATDEASAVRQIVNASRSHAALRTAEGKVAELNQQYQQTGTGLSDLEAMALRSTIADKLAKPDISDEVSRRLQGEPLPMTSDHDAEIDRIAREQERIARDAFIESNVGDSPWEEDYLAAQGAWDGATWRAGFMVKHFGRVTDQMTDQISTMLTTADMPHLPDEQRFEMFRNGMGLFKGIHDQSPTYARHLIQEERIPIKAQAILNLSMTRGTDIDQLISAYGPISPSLFSMADAMIEDVNNQSPSSMQTRAEEWAQGPERYSNSADVDRYWRSVYRAEVASRLHYGGEGQDPNALLKDARNVANAKVQEAFSSVSVNGEAYPIPNQELQGYGWGSDEGQTLRNISRTWREHRDRLRDETIASSFEPVWDQRRVVGSNLVVPVMSAEMGSAESMNQLSPWVIPLDPSMIKVKAHGSAEEKKVLYESEAEMVKDLFWFVPGIDRLR